MTGDSKLIPSKSIISDILEQITYNNQQFIHRSYEFIPPYSKPSHVNVSFA